MPRKRDEIPSLSLPDVVISTKNDKSCILEYYCPYCKDYHTAFTVTGQPGNCRVHFEFTLGGAEDLTFVCPETGKVVTELRLREDIIKKDKKEEIQ